MVARTKGNTLKLKTDSGALLRMAMLHLSNAIAHQAVADSRYGKRKGVPLDCRDAEMVSAVALCAQAMVRHQRKPRQEVRRKQTQRKLKLVHGRRAA
jgi:hypothetical protein